MEVSRFSTGFRPLKESPSVALLLERTSLCRWNQVQLFPVKGPVMPLVGRSEALHWKQNPSQVIHCQLREVPMIEAGCMEEIYDMLARRLIPVAAAESNHHFKHIVGLCGPPGAGKSTVASEVASRVNQLWDQKASFVDYQVNSPPVATVLPMDGFHLYRHELDAMEDPKEAHARRGGELLGHLIPNDS